MATKSRPRARRQPAPPESFWDQLNKPIASGLIIAILMSCVTWIAFRATVIARLDALTETVNEIKAQQMPRVEIDDRLRQDERRLDQLTRQVSEDERMYFTVTTSAGKR